MSYMPTFQVSNLRVPAQGPRVLPFELDFASVASISGEVASEIIADDISWVQSAWIDNTDNAADFELEILITGQRVFVQAGAQASVPIFAATGTLQYVARSTAGAGNLTRVQFANFVMQPYNTNCCGEGGVVPDFDELFYMTTATPAAAADAAANAAANVLAFAADFAAVAANGKLLVIPPPSDPTHSYYIGGGNTSSNTGGGTIKGVGTGAVDVSNLRGINIWQLPGALIRPAPGAANSTPIMFYFRSCIVKWKGAALKGDRIPEICIRADESGSSNLLSQVQFEDPLTYNYGFTSAGGVLGVYGILLRGCEKSKVSGHVAYDILAQSTGTYASQPGLSRALFTFNCIDVDISGFQWSGADGREVDYFHNLDQSAGGIRSLITLRDGTITCDGNTRRCYKSQGGLQVLFDNVNCRKDPAATPVPLDHAYFRVTSISKAASAHVIINGVAASTGILANGNIVEFSNTPGMVEINGLRGTVSGLTTVGSTTEFDVNIDSSGFTAYTAGQFGECRRRWTITGITNANPGVVTLESNHTLVNGQKITFRNTGVPQLDNLDFTVNNITTTQNNFQLYTTAYAPVDTSLFTPWTAGGEILLYTDVGLRTLTAVDYAGSVAGKMVVKNSYIDATLFISGIAQSIGPLGKIVVDNVECVGSKLKAIRYSLENNVYDYSPTTGFSTATTNLDCVFRNSNFINFCRGCAPSGDNIKFYGITFDDPVELWMQAGSTTQKSDLNFSNVEVITRTPGWMSLTRMGRFDNFLRVSGKDIKLIERGNGLQSAGVPGHAARFLEAINANATGVIYDIDTPATTTPFFPGSANVIHGRQRGQTLNPVHITTGVGNVGGGTDDLLVATLPAYALNWPGNAVEIEAVFTIANNANAKTVNLVVGSTNIVSQACTVSQAGKVFIRAVLTGTAASAQDYDYTLIQYGTTEIRNGNTGTLANNSTLTMTVKTTGAGVADNDIICERLTIRSLQGGTIIQP